MKQFIYFKSMGIKLGEFVDFIRANHLVIVSIKEVNKTHKLWEIKIYN